VIYDQLCERHRNLAKIMISAMERTSRTIGLKVCGMTQEDDEVI